MIYAATGNTLLDVAQVTLRSIVVFSGVSISHCKPGGSGASPSQVGSVVVLPSNSGLVEAFTQPPNAEFTRGFLASVNGV